MHLLSHISESIWHMHTGDNFTNNNSEYLKMGNSKEACLSANIVICMLDIHKHIAWCTGLHYMEEMQSFLDLQRWYNINTAKVFIVLSTADQSLYTLRAHVLHLLHCQDQQFFHSISHHVHYLKETHVNGVHRTMILNSISDTSNDFGISFIVLLFSVQIEEDRVHKVIGLVLGYVQNALKDNICINLQNWLLYYCQTFHYPAYIYRESRTWLQGRIYWCQ